MKNICNTDNLFIVLLILLTVYFFLTSAVNTNADENDFSGLEEDTLFGDDMIITEEETETGNGEDSMSEDDDMFDNSMVDEYDETTLDAGLDTLLLKSDTLEIGGNYTFSISSSWTWQSYDLSPEYVIDNIEEADIVALSTTLKASLFLDARPDENFRVFAKTDIEAPFTESRESETGDIPVIDNPFLPDEEWTFEDIIGIRELFADFNWNNSVFFRAGKHMIKWGVGYFFSPADVLNITPIDPEDPDADREGPISLKTHIPIDIHNLYLYLIIPEQTTYPDEIAIAPKFEFVTGNLETGIGGYFHLYEPSAGILTVSFPVISSIDLFAEAVVSYGSNKPFLEETDQGIIAVDREDEFFFSGTAGFLFFLDQVDMDWESVMIAGQYFFNGQGYEDPFISENIFRIAPLIGTGDIPFQALMQTGMHYVAGSLIWSSMFDTDFSASVFWISNLTDGSGQLTPSVSWEIIEYVQASLRIPVFYGDDFTEFALMGERFGIQLDISLGSGKF